MKLVRFILIPAVLFLLPCFASPLHAQWEPDVRLTYNDSASLLSNNNAHCLAASGDTLHVVWHDKRTGNYEIFYKRSTDAGTTWSPDTNLTDSPDSSINPTIAVSGSNVHLVWQDHRDGNWEIYYKRSTDCGSSWGADTRLTADSGVSVNPSLTVLDTMLHLVWSDNRSGVYKIFYKRSLNSGISWSPDQCLTASETGSHATPGISGSGAWLQLVYASSDSNGSIMYRWSLNFGRSWYGAIALARGRADYVYNISYWNPSIFTTANKVYVVWEYNELDMGYEEYSGIVLKGSLDGGFSWNINYGWGQMFSAYKSPAVCASGQYVNAVWSEWLGTGNHEICYGRSADSGATWAPDTNLTSASPDSSVHPFVTIQDAKVNLVWVDYRDGNSEIYYKRNLTGNAVEENKSPSPVSYLSYFVRPNPFTSFATIPGHEADRFALYDISGRRVGTYKGDRIGEGLAAGVYFIRTSDSKDKPLRIVKVR